MDSIPEHGSTPPPLRLSIKPSPGRQKFLFPGKENIEVAQVNSNQSQIKESASLAKFKFQSLTIAEPSLEGKKRPRLALLAESSLFHSESHSLLSEEELSNLGVTRIPTEVANEDFLEEKGFLINATSLGKGNYGAVYDITSPYQKSPNSLIYKSEVKSRPINFGEKFWRHSAFAPTRLNLPHLAKVDSFLITVAFSDHQAEKLFLPADKAKEFGQFLQRKDPRATVTINAQIISKAPGKTLAQFLKDSTLSFEPESHHFKIILSALHNFLETAHAANFIHRDLKLENIMYDPHSGTVTIIDTGESSRLRARNKTSPEVKGPSNPETSTKSLGTKVFMSPKIIKGENYGSEVDFFSTGMLLLKFMSPTDFDSFLARRGVGSFDDILLEENPKEFLSLYLKSLPENSKTEALFAKSPWLQEIIQLDFEASAGESEIDSTPSLHALNRLHTIFSQFSVSQPLI